METYDVYQFFCKNALIDGKMYIMTEEEAIETMIKYEARCVKIYVDSYSFDNEIFEPYDEFYEI